MADADKATLEKIGKLTVLLRELQAKEYEITEEMSRLLGGEAGIGDKLKQVEVAFDAAWCRRYSPGTTKQYIWAYAKDRALLKRLLKTLTVEQIEARIAVFIRNDDPWFVKNRHTFSIFAGTVNQHAPESAESFALDAPVRDCHHSPPCVSDPQHTTLRMKEMRGSAF